MKKRKNRSKKKSRSKKKNQQTLEPNFYSANSLMITTNIDSQNSDDVAAAPYNNTNEHVALLISITRKKKE